ncbi:MAG: hypothetical protein VYA55_16585 [Pseudomonadota bacterium]|nr:hypothetical protein [Pseudomonadota bacterium]
MSEVKSDTNSKRSTSQDSTNPAQKRRSYGYGLGHFFKSKQRYSPVAEKDVTHAFERGYN